MLGMSDVAVVVPADDTQRIQEAHGVIIHLLCELVESALEAPVGAAAEATEPAVALVGVGE